MSTLPSSVVTRVSNEVARPSTAVISDCRVSTLPSSVVIRAARAVVSEPLVPISECNSLIAADRSVATVSRVAEPCLVSSAVARDSTPVARPSTEVRRPPCRPCSVSRAVARTSTASISVCRVSTLEASVSSSA